MKRLLLILVLLSALIPSAAYADGDWNELRYEEPVTLSLLLDPNQAQPSDFDEVIELIEEKLNIVTEIYLRPSGNYVKSLLAMGDMTDLCVYNSGSLFKALNPDVYFADLSNESFAKRIDEAFTQSVSVSGGLYGIPLSTSYVGGWLYNKDIHEQLGLDEPRTWEELMANCEAISQAGILPVIGGYKDGWSSQIVLLADYHNLVHEYPNFADDYNARRAGFSSTPAALRGFEKLYELHEKAYLNADANEISHKDACRMFAEGKAAYLPSLSNSLPLIEEANPDKINRIGVFGQPGDDVNHQGITVWLPSGIYLSNTSQNIEAAKRWMTFYLSDEGLNAFAAGNKLTGPYVIDNVKSNRSNYTCIDSLSRYSEQNSAVPALEFSSALKGTNLSQITQECAAGLITPKAAAQLYDQDVERGALIG